MSSEQGGEIGLTESPSLLTPAHKRRAIATGLSLGFHGVALLALLSSASGELMSAAAGGGDPGPMMEVTMVGPPSRAAPAAKPEPSRGFKPLVAKFATDLSPPPVEVSDAKTSDLGRLANRLQDRAPAPSPPKPQPVTPPDKGQDTATQTPPKTAPAPTPTKVVTPGPPAPKPAKGEALKASGSTGGLWGRIEPCWRERATNARIPVSLEVSIDARGSLSVPPRILREAAAGLSEERLNAEASALQALSACLPRGDLRYAGKSFRLDFLPVE